MAVRRAFFCVTVHHAKIGADQRREIDLVDHQQVGPGNARAALAGDFVTGRDVDHIDSEIGELRAEGGREVVAAGFDNHQIELGKFSAQIGDRRQIHRGILVDRGMGTATGFNTGDTVRRQRPRPGQELGVFLRVDIVGDHRDLVSVAELLAQGIGECCFAGANRPANTDPQRAMSGRCHDRKSLEYWVSCRMESRSNSGEADPKSSSAMVIDWASTFATERSSAAMANCPSDWPRGIRRTPAETRLAAKPWK